MQISKDTLAGRTIVAVVYVAVIALLAAGILLGVWTAREMNAVVTDQFNAQQMVIAQTAKAREWLRNPVRFEPTAFVLTRLSPEVPTVHFANLRGEYFGVEATPEGTRVAVRAMLGTSRNYWLAQLSRWTTRKLTALIAERMLRPRVPGRAGTAASAA